MTTAEIVVTLLGILAIAWVNYYFFVTGEKSVSGERARPFHRSPLTVHCLRFFRTSHAD